MASRPIATARWVLPTPGGPRSRSASPFAMKRPVASSRTWLLSIEGWAAKSKPARSRTNGKRASPMLISMRRSSLRAISALAEHPQRRADRQLAPARLIDQAVELVADRRQLEAGEHRHQMIVG